MSFFSKAVVDVVGKEASEAAKAAVKGAVRRAEEEALKKGSKEAGHAAVEKGAGEGIRAIRERARRAAKLTPEDVEHLKKDLGVRPKEAPHAGGARRKGFANDPGLKRDVERLGAPSQARLGEREIAGSIDRHQRVSDIKTVPLTTGERPRGTFRSKH